MASLESGPCGTIWRCARSIYKSAQERHRPVYPAVLHQSVYLSVRPNLTPVPAEIQFIPCLCPDVSVVSVQLHPEQSVRSRSDKRRSGLAYSRDGLYAKGHDGWTRQGTSKVQTHFDEQ